jgi:broad specificity phosphatase PhoE
MRLTSSEQYEHNEERTEARQALKLEEGVASDMNTIYLVRHGENTANLTGEFSYKHVDYSLTPKGRVQAQQTAAFFKDKRIDAIYSSPLKRARETAAIIGQALELPVTNVEQFREVNVGDLEGRPPTAENWAIHNRIVADWLSGKREVAFPGGENCLQLLRRMQEGLLEVTRTQEGKHLIIVGHGGLFTFTLNDLCPNVEMEEIIRQVNHNCSVTTIELDSCEERPAGVLKAWALCTHLSGETAPSL